jgi:hypothetical protein
MILKIGVSMSNTKLISLLLFLSHFTSCSFLQSVPEKNFEILSGDKKSINLSKKEIENELSIEQTLAMNTFRVKVFPLVSDYIERFSKDDLLLENLPKSNDKTCFITEIISDSSNPKAVEFNTWKAEALDDNDDFIHMEWTGKTLTQVATTKTVPSYHGPKKRFYNRGVLCAVDKLETSRYFQVKLSPKLVQWPLKGDIRFDWRVPYKTHENGVEVIKRKKKRIQAYKGW